MCVFRHARAVIISTSVLGSFLRLSALQLQGGGSASLTYIQPHRQTADDAAMMTRFAFFLLYIFVLKATEAQKGTLLISYSSSDPRPSEKSHVGLPVTPIFEEFLYR